jgi:integrase
MRIKIWFSQEVAGKIFGLTWDKVHLKERDIELEEEDTKTSEPRRIYLTPVLDEMFLKRPRVRHINHNSVFTYKGEPVKEIKGAFGRACKKAGIKDFRFHDLRHTFNTNMRKAGVDRSVIMKITGHKTTSMFERYNTIDRDDARDAIKRLDEFLTKPSSGEEITSILLQGPDRETSPPVTP